MVDAAGHGRPHLPPDLGGRGSKSGGGGASSKASSKSMKEARPCPGSVEAVMALSAANGKAANYSGGDPRTQFLDAQIEAQKLKKAENRRSRAVADMESEHCSQPLQPSLKPMEVDVSAASHGERSSRVVQKLKGTKGLEISSGDMEVECEGSASSGSSEETKDSSSDDDSLAMDSSNVDEISAMVEGKNRKPPKVSIDSRLCLNSSMVAIEPRLCLNSSVGVIVPHLGVENSNLLLVGAAADHAMSDNEDAEIRSPSARSNAPSIVGADFEGNASRFGSENGMQGVCYDVPMKNSAEFDGNQPRLWSEVTGKGTPASRKINTVIPIPQRKSPSTYNPAINTVRLCDESREGQHERFEAALVGRLFGHRLPHVFLRDELYKRWEKFGSFRMIAAGPNCFMCLFDDVRARDQVLIGGPWIVAGQVIGIDKWSQDFSPTSEVGFITLVWVRLPDLAFDCWELENLGRILEAIGMPLWIDAATTQLDRGSFARACVKINLAKPLNAGLWLEDK